MVGADLVEQFDVVCRSGSDVAELVETTRVELLLCRCLRAVGGPLAFLAGERLGGVVFTSYGAGITALALGWAALMPLMILISNRWDGFDSAEAPRTVAAAID